MSEERIDILNRDEFVDKVFNVIENLSANHKSCTFAINGEWGSGKSFVLDMLEEKLSMWQNEETADDQYIVFHYNCWKYDYYEEPLIAIVSALYDEAKRQCDFFKPETNQKFKDVWTRTKSSVGFIAGGVTQRLFGVNARDMHREVEKDVEASHDNKEYDENYSFQNVILDTKQKIAEIAKEQTVIVVVDELDRCLPEYAIKVLERLHHLFDDVENLIVILAVDKEHLNNTVSQIFGFEKNNYSKDINSYLAKFIDFEINLDKGIVNENYRLKYAEYLSKFDVDKANVNLDLLISKLLKPIDARTREKLIGKAIMLHELVFNDVTVNPAIMLVELLWIIFKSENKNEKVIIDSKLFLPNEFHSKYKDFVDVFEDSFVKKLTVVETSFPNMYYIVRIYSDDFGDILIYLLLCNPYFTISNDIKFENITFDISQLSDEMKRFADLLEIIN